MVARTKAGRVSSGCFQIPRQGIPPLSLKRQRFQPELPGRGRQHSLPLPDETIVDGEIVALDPNGRPSFNILQNHGSSGVPLVSYVSDLMMLKAETSPAKL